MVRCNRVPKALISTEFIFVFPIALTVVLAIMGFGFTGYQRARIDYSLAHLADPAYPRAGIPWTRTLS